MTARRDLTELERQGIARRTHGGAVLPGNSVPVTELVCESEAPQVELIAVGGRCAS
jgi:DeoR/GlpR family transcriptional regulator of sugar metabolism